MLLSRRLGCMCRKWVPFVGVTGEKRKLAKFLICSPIGELKVVVTLHFDLSARIILYSDDAGRKRNNSRHTTLPNNFCRYRLPQYQLILLIAPHILGSSRSMRRHFIGIDLVAVAVSVTINMHTKCMLCILVQFKCILIQSETKRRPLSVKRRFSSVGAMSELCLSLLSDSIVR